jgi:hypothetical protein
VQGSVKEWMRKEARECRVCRMVKTGFDSRSFGFRCMGFIFCTVLDVLIQCATRGETGQEHPYEVMSTAQNCAPCSECKICAKVMH